MDKYFVFDVESAGLRGPGFAFGFVVVDATGKELDGAFATSGVDSISKMSLEDRKWLEANLPKEILYPQGEFKLTRAELITAFKNALRKHSDAIVVSDCGYPVESQWLFECNVPVYPLHDLATAMFVIGKDPLANYARKKNELPKHHPLADARQSARLWVGCLKKMTKRSAK